MRRMLNNESFKQIGFSVFSNTVVLLMSLITGLFLAKYVSVETYASYKTFFLFAGYLGFFHFGFINGIYLKYGGMDYVELPKNRFRAYTRFLVITQISVQIVMLTCMIPYYVQNGSFLSAYVFVILNLLFINVNCYFNLINQFTRRFVLDGTIQLIQKIVCVIGIVILLLFKSDNYVSYLTLLTIANALTLILLMLNDRELVFGSHSRFDFSEIKSMISHGFFIMISEYMGLIIVGIDSIIINLFFPQSSFSVYAFAVTIISVMYQLTNVISKPIFPYLKRQNFDSLVRLYGDMKMGCVIFSAFIGGIATIVPWLIRLLIPKYNASIPIVQILCATVIIRGVLDLILGNYYKVLSLERLFAKTNIIALLTGLITDVIAYNLFHKMEAIAIASVISFSIWYIVSDVMLKRRMHIRSYGPDLLLIVTVVILLTLSAWESVWGMIIFYILVIISVILYLKKTDIIHLLKEKH